MLILNRFSSSDKCTIGELHFHGRFICYTLEPHNFGFKRTSDVNEVRSKKILFPGKVAIPYGDYTVSLSYSPKFSHKAFYKEHGGLLPRLENVPCFSGILIHVGNYPSDTKGCILVGNWNGGEKLISSRESFLKVLDIFVKHPGKHILRIQ